MNTEEKLIKQHKKNFYCAASGIIRIFNVLILLASAANMTLKQCFLTCMPGPSFLVASTYYGSSNPQLEYSWVLKH